MRLRLLLSALLLTLTEGLGGMCANARIYGELFDVDKVQGPVEVRTVDTFGTDSIELNVIPMVSADRIGIRLALSNDVVPPGAEARTVIEPVAEIDNWMTLIGIGGPNEAHTTTIDLRDIESKLVVPEGGRVEVGQLAIDVLEDQQTKFQTRGANEVVDNFLTRLVWIDEDSRGTPTPLLPLQVGQNVFTHTAPFDAFGVQVQWKFGGGPAAGIVLDEVVVKLIPEPASACMCVMGLLGLALTRSTFRKTIGFRYLTTGQARANA